MPFKPRGELIAPRVYFDSETKTAFFTVEVNGKKTRRTAHCDTKEVALAAYNDLRAAVKKGIGPQRIVGRPQGATQGTKVFTGATTLGEFHDDYRATLLARNGGNENPTARANRLQWTRVKDVAATRRLDAVNLTWVQDVQEMLKGRRQTGADGQPTANPQYTARTINVTISYIRQLVSRAVNAQILKGMPIATRSWPMLKTEDIQQELTGAERARFIDAFDDREGWMKIDWMTHGDRSHANYWYEEYRSWKPFFVVALETGAAIGDVRLFTWDNVDARNGGTITYRRQKTHEPATIGITLACRAALQEIARTNRPRKGAYLRTGIYSGKPVDEDRIRERMKLALRLAKIPHPTRFHDLRHTFGCRLGEAGASLKDIAKAMGHASTKHTEKYARVGGESIERVRALLDAPSVAAPAARSANNPPSWPAPAQPQRHAAGGWK